MESSEEEHFLGSLKKRKRKASNCKVESDTDEDSNEVTTPCSSAHKLDTSRSSERLRSKKKFVMPKREDVWEKIPSEKKKCQSTPGKINNFTREKNRYNADKFNTFEDELYGDDDMDDFINDEDADSDNDSVRNKRRVKGFRRRLLSRNSDSSDTSSDSCETLGVRLDTDKKKVHGDTENSCEVDDLSMDRVPNTHGLKVRKVKNKGNVIESSDSNDSEVEQDGQDHREIASNVVNQNGLEKQPTECRTNINSNISDNRQNTSETLTNIRSDILQGNDVNSTNNQNHQTDGFDEVLVTDSDQELYEACQAIHNQSKAHSVLESVDDNAISRNCVKNDIGSDSSESENSDNESEESEEEPDTEKYDRAYRHKQEKLNKFQQFKLEREKKLKKR